MKKNKGSLFVLISTLFIFSNPLIAQEKVDVEFVCPVGAPTNPNPPSGATNLPITGNTLTWTNGAGTLLNEVYIEGTLVYSGNAITKFSLTPIEPLNYNTTYNWRVVCKNDTCGTSGPNWTFTTMQDPLLSYVEIFFDDFTAGLGNWTITNDGGVCVWMLLSISSNAYTLPATAQGNILAADSDLCGSGTSIRSTAIINDSFDFLGIAHFCYYSIWIEFDSDWRIIDSEDEAHVEISTNGGFNWISVWSKVGIDARNSHEVIDISSIVRNHEGVRIRLRTIQPGWDWWWAVDNFRISTSYCLSCPQPVQPSNLIASATGYQEVTLNWQDNSNNEIQFIVERKEGDSLSTNMFAILDSVPANTTSHIDNSVTDSSVYTYRVKTYNQCCHSRYSNLVQVLAWIPVELVSFSANVMNNNVELSWITATELNNSRFEIQRLKDYKITELQDWEEVGFVEGKGTTTETQYYSFTDKNLSSGKYQYRLRQIDFNGSYEYSYVIEAEIEMPNEFLLGQNYPNPFNPTTKIKYQIPSVIASGTKQSQMISLKVYDILGREVLTLVNEEKQPGVYEVDFDASGLSSGIYYYELKSREFRSIKKMVLLR